MSHDWQPGNVAILRCQDLDCFTMEHPAILGKSGEWWLIDRGEYLSSHDAEPCRPLVVIDPEDREQVESLVVSFIEEYQRLTPETPGGVWTAKHVETMQAVLREHSLRDAPEWSPETPPTQESAAREAFAELLNEHEGALTEALRRLWDQEPINRQMREDISDQAFYLDRLEARLDDIRSNYHVPTWTPWPTPTPGYTDLTAATGDLLMTTPGPTTFDVPLVLAMHRCQDVHAVRWDQPTDLRAVMDPCEACQSWGQHVAAALEHVSPTVADDTGLRDGIRHVITECLDRRTHWANSPQDGAVARAVAYQSIAGLLIRELDETPARWR